MTMANGTFPRTRMRRNRKDDWSRRMVAEQKLTIDDLVWPLFLQEAAGSTPISSLPGVERMDVDMAIESAKMAAKLKIPAISLFPATPAGKKTQGGEEALNPDNLVCRTVRAVKTHVAGVGVICDVALDPYTSHGHDGIYENGDVHNDKTIAALCEQAVTLAHAGADIIAPSDMMDGRVGAIRDALDAAGHDNVQILSYSAKYASAFYGPFRDAVGSSGGLGTSTKQTYQMDPSNSREAMREVAMDIEEGADIVMVKPGMPYLDIIQRVHSSFAVPVFTYQVSGEYAMMRFAAQNGALDFKSAMVESLKAYKRAGASAIFTYAAPEVAAWLNEEEQGDQ